MDPKSMTQEERLDWLIDYLRHDHVVPGRISDRTILFGEDAAQVLSDVKEKLGK